MSAFKAFMQCIYGAAVDDVVEMEHIMVRLVFTNVLIILRIPTVCLSVDVDIFT